MIFDASFGISNEGYKEVNEAISYALKSVVIKL
jgi:hypothetical protein